MDNGILKSEVILRKAVIGDVENIFLWRNFTENRKYSFNSYPISWEEHQNWFSNSLQREDRFLLIGEIENNPVGVLRYDLQRDVAEINIYLVPGLYGKGLGTKLLQAGNEWLFTNLPTIKRISAKVIPDNIASQKAFIKAGFKESYKVYEYFTHEDKPK